ncbi:MAG: hypothetical protein GOMPHAMPRED_000337 [Gomphillus americanus]|uniref:Large ribosomal subunit protein uL23m n=1 Tax=Gomphillus americanus TaxID=1940652 RepID=A0A8H3I1E6_9LECA|nr:MAG: hypothetical protein GOMPHAMPRED_000337 [Gomphillus americanus]
MACFQVPLNINKLDMKDYLWNCYGVPALSVRSYIQQQKVRAGKANDIIPQRRWARPKSTKRMIVELGEGQHGGPFVWPDPIENLEPWDKASYDELRTEQEEQSSVAQRRWERRPMKNKDILAKQAQELLSGSKKWQPMQTIYARNGTDS